LKSRMFVPLLIAAMLLLAACSSATPAAQSTQPVESPTQPAPTTVAPTSPPAVPTAAPTARMTMAAPDDSNTNGNANDNANSNANANDNANADSNANANGNDNSSAPGAAVSVDIKGFAFDPSPLTVKAGTTVTWENKDSAPHNVIADNSEFKSGTLQEGGEFSFTFTQAGTYPYYCSFHGGPGGQGMSGQVIVTP
jgi:plastocyanin